MKMSTLSVIWLGAAASLLPNLLWSKLQENSAANLVAVQGLKPTYSSCTLVPFSVRNSSQEEVYVEVYVEEFKSNKWDVADYPYDLKDPRSLYIKRVIVNPDMMKPGSSLDLTYDRCLKPKFIHETNNSFITAIKTKDKNATTRILQRLRVDVYLLEEGHIKREQQVWSESFARITDKPAASPR
jgi:hypothetical protein